MADVATGAGETRTTDLPRKQNSLKQLNVTREKIKNGTKREEHERTEREGNVPHSRLSIMLLRRSLAFVKAIKTKRNIENLSYCSRIV